MSAKPSSRALPLAAALGSALLLVVVLPVPAQASEGGGFSTSGVSARPQRAAAEVAAAAATAGCGNVAIAPDPGGSPAGGYLPLSAFAYEPIAGVGDDTQTTFSVPAFSYAGGTYTTLAVASNGYVQVGTSAGPDAYTVNQNFPDATIPNNLLAPFWTDLDPSAAGEIRIGVLTDGVDDWIVVDWNAVQEFAINANQHSFEIWIGVDGDGNPGQDITYVYGTNVGNGSGFLTVGAENSTGTSGGTTFFNGTGTLPSSGTELRVTSTPGLVAAFDATPASGEEPLSVDFDATASSDDGSIASYDWDFGDGSTDSGATTSHEYAAAGVYTATLTVTDDVGNTCSSSQEITVTSPFSVDDVSVDESDGTATFTVTRSGGPAASVDIAAVAGSATTPEDFTAAPATLSFDEDETSKTFDVTIVADPTDEYDETYSVELSNPVNGSLGDASGVGTIVDDDAAPTLSINDVNVLEGGKGATTPITFTVSLSAASARSIAVTASTANGSAKVPSDYVKKVVVVSFAPGETTATVTVDVKGDKAHEGNEVFFVLLSSAVNATIADASGSGGILTDE